MYIALSSPAIILALCSIFVLSLSLSLGVRYVARRAGLVAAPRSDRWHQKPTALFGGVAIYLAFMIGSLSLLPLDSKFLPIIAGASMLFFVGVLDDLLQLRPYVKLIAQLVVASGVVYSGLHLPWTEYSSFNELLTIFWLVGITNAINLLDNMDGLAAGISAIACIFVGIGFYLNGQSPEMLIALILFVSILGFLILNFNPATIFMGDCGSMFLGFTLGGLCLLSDYGRTRNLLAVLATPVLIFMIPIFDTCLVTLTRKLRGQPVSQGGKDHASHRLVALGMSERRAVLMLYLFAASSGTLTLLLRWIAPDYSILLVPSFALAVIIMGFYLGKVTVYEGTQKAQNVFTVIADFSYKRRVFEVLLDSCLIVMAYFAAYVLRWDADVPLDQRLIFFRTLPIVLSVQLGGFLLGGLYRGLWRYTGVDDLIKIARATVIGAVLSGAAILVMYDFVGPSRGVLVLDLILLLVLVASSRLSFRLIRAFVLHNRTVPPGANSIVIYGAGDGGELLLRELVNGNQYQYTAVAFVDDDARKIGKKLHGVQIYDSEDLPKLVANFGVQEVVLSTNKVSESRIKRVKELGLGLKKLSIKIS